MNFALRIGVRVLCWVGELLTVICKQRESCWSPSTSISYNKYNFGKILILNEQNLSFLTWRNPTNFTTPQPIRFWLGSTRINWKMSITKNLRVFTLSLVMTVHAKRSLLAMKTNRNIHSLHDCIFTSNVTNQKNSNSLLKSKLSSMWTHVCVLVNGKYFSASFLNFRDNFLRIKYTLMERRLRSAFTKNRDCFHNYYTVKFE